MKTTLKSNLSVAEDLEKRKNIIIDSQIEEAVWQLQKSGSVLSAAEVGKYFTDNFGKSLISPLFASFCKRLFSLGMCESAILKKPRADEKIAYMKSIYTDKAFEEFSRTRNSTASFEASFRSSCEAVYDGWADYCILPAASTDEGVFSLFYKLLRAHDLKICDECYITKDDTEAEMRFALMSASPEHTGSERHLSFSFLPDGRDNEIADVIAMICAAGAHIQAVNYIPLEYSIERNECHFTLELDSDSAGFFLFLLEAAVPSSTVTGIYK